LDIGIESFEAAIQLRSDADEECELLERGEPKSASKTKQRNVEAGR
jgi:hypothetical protein